jgi:hypothetical protein
MRIPFRFVHAENAVLILLGFAGWGAAVAQGYTTSGALNRVWFSWIIILIDEVILVRHHLTRNGFTTIERPLDISWVVEGHGESIRLLHGEEEENFAAHCRSDIVTSVAAFVGLFLGVLLRKIMRPLFFDD